MPDYTNQVARAEKIIQDLIAVSSDPVLNSDCLVSLDIVAALRDEGLLISDTQQDLVDKLKTDTATPQDLLDTATIIFPEAALRQRPDGHILILTGLRQMD